MQRPPDSKWQRTTPTATKWRGAKPTSAKNTLIVGEQEISLPRMQSIGQGNYGYVYRSNFNIHHRNIPDEFRHNLDPNTGSFAIKISKEEGQQDLETEIEIGDRIRETTEQAKKKGQVVEGSQFVSYKSSAKLVQQQYNGERTESIVAIGNYEKNGTLDDYLSREDNRVLPADKKIEMLTRIMWQQLSALVFLHNDANVIHRDLAVRNFLVDANGNVKISDFGMAAELSSDPNAEFYPKSTIGAAMWMPLKSIESYVADRPQDVFAIKVTILEQIAESITGNLWAIWGDNGQGGILEGAVDFVNTDVKYKNRDRDDNIYLQSLFQNLHAVINKHVKVEEQEYFRGYVQSLKRLFESNKKANAVELLTAAQDLFAKVLSSSEIASIEEQIKTRASAPVQTTKSQQTVPDYRELSGVANALGTTNTTPENPDTTLNSQRTVPDYRELSEVANVLGSTNATPENPDTTLNSQQTDVDYSGLSQAKDAPGASNTTDDFDYGGLPDAADALGASNTTDNFDYGVLPDIANAIGASNIGGHRLKGSHNGGSAEVREQVGSENSSDAQPVKERPGTFKIPNEYDDLTKVEEKMREAQARPAQTPVPPAQAQPVHKNQGSTSQILKATATPSNDKPIMPQSNPSKKDTNAASPKVDGTKTGSVADKIKKFEAMAKPVTDPANPSTKKETTEIVPPIPTNTRRHP